VTKKTADKDTIFVCWSGDKSLELARFVYRWLPKHLDGARAWASFNQLRDLPLGKPDHAKIVKAAKRCGACVAVITRENNERPWLGYETGIFTGLKKTVYVMLCDMTIDEFRGMGHPLAALNAVTPKLPQIRNCLLGLNSQLGLGIDQKKVREISDLAFQEYVDACDRAFPELTEAEREMREFEDYLED